MSLLFNMNVRFTFLETSFGSLIPDCESSSKLKKPTVSNFIPDIFIKKKFETHHLFFKTTNSSNQLGIRTKATSNSEKISSDW